MTKLFQVCLSVLVMLVTLAAAQAQPRRIGWPDLLGTEAQDFVLSRQAMSGNGLTTNQALLGHEVELSGYLLPVDREGDDIYAFMLVPVPGACSHMPSPAPNQIVQVSLRKPYVASEIYEPVSVRGTLRADHGKSQLFILDGVKVVETAYSMGAARVSPAPDLPPPAGLGNPLLKKHKK